MVVTQGEDGLRMEHQGRIYRLDAGDVLRLSKMTPMGRKVHFRRKAKEILSRHPGNADAALLLEWTGLLAKEWMFSVPE